MLSDIITKHCNQFNLKNESGTWTAVQEIVPLFSLDKMHINKTCQGDITSPRFLYTSTRPARMMLPHLDSSLYVNKTCQDATSPRLLCTFELACIREERK